MRLEFHPKLGQRSAGDHGDLVGNTGLNQAGAVHHCVHRPGAKRLGVGARRVFTADVFGDRFGEIAAASIVTIADRFLGATDDVVDLVRL